MKIHSLVGILKPNIYEATTTLQKQKKPGQYYTRAPNQIQLTKTQPTLSSHCPVQANNPQYQHAEKTVFPGIAIHLRWMS
jgi:hypothetical protein